MPNGRGSWPADELSSRLPAGHSGGARQLRWGRISYELLPHPYKWHGSLPQQLPRFAIALGGVIAVHLWTTISPVPPPARIACARMLGFWSLPRAQEESSTTTTPAGYWRVGPLLKQSEKALPHEALYAREALVVLLARLRESRARELRALGHRSSAPGFAEYVPLQRHGRGTWPDGTRWESSHAPRPTLNYSAPGGKCGVGMFAYWQHNEDT